MLARRQRRRWRGAAALAAGIATALSPALARSQGAVAGALPSEATPEEEPVGAAHRSPTYETVVTAPRAAEETPEETRISREVIERSAAQSLADLLEREAGVYASTGVRGERHFAIRGFDQRQIYIVVDDVPLYLPYDGDLDLGKLPTELIEDVVVLRPPGSLRYGPAGMGGTLSIRTRQPGEGPAVATRLELGRGGHARLGATHSYRLGPVSWLVGAGVESREGYELSGRFDPTPSEDGGLRDQSDRLIRHVMGRVRLDLGDDGYVEATAFRVDGAFGIPPSTVSRRPRYWRVTELSNTVATLVHRWRPAPGLVLQETAFVGLFDDLLDAFDDATLTSQDRADSFHSWYHDLSAGGFARLRWALPRRALLRLEAGARYENHVKEQVLGGHDDWERDEVGRGLVFLGAQLESWLGPSWRLAAAVQTEAEAGLSQSAPPSADAMVSLRWDPVDGPLQVGLSAARRSRIPTLKERFSETGGAGTAGRLANPDLRPETALHLNLDARYQPMPWLRAEATVFEAEVQDLITLTPIDADRDRFENVDRSRQAGVELGLGLQPWPWLDVEVAYAFLWAREVGEDGALGPLPYRPEHLGRLAVRARPVRGLEISTALRVVGPQQFLDAELSSWRELGIYVVWDARVEGEPWPGIRFWIQGTNLLDASYQTQYGYPEPGWQLWGGVQVEFLPREAG